MAHRAYPQHGPTAARRAWRVDIGTAPQRVSCSAPDCPGTDQSAGATVQASALAHLASHARHEPLADHLRICRCRAHGCTWHPRHLGCAGPISLVVFRQARGRVWQLADACAGCARAIPHAAEIPCPAPAADFGQPTRPKSVKPGPCTAQEGNEGDEDALRAVLRYLDAALAPSLSPAATLLALVCLLRADAAGCARLPRGLLRSLRLAHQQELLMGELTQVRWLRSDTAAAPGRPSDPAAGGITLRIADLAAGAAVPGGGQRTRRRLLDQVLRGLTDQQDRTAGHHSPPTALPAGASWPRTRAARA